LGFQILGNHLEPMGVGGGNGRSPIGKEKKNGYKKEGGREERGRI
jgi:hypothetical protein